MWALLFLAGDTHDDEYSVPSLKNFMDIFFSISDDKPMAIDLTFGACG